VCAAVKTIAGAKSAPGLAIAEKAQAAVNAVKVAQVGRHEGAGSEGWDLGSSLIILFLLYSEPRLFVLHN